eukprot:819080-Prymnesium_polylepis.1
MASRASTQAGSSSKRGRMCVPILGWVGAILGWFVFQTGKGVRRQDECNALLSPCRPFFRSQHPARSIQTAVEPRCVPRSTLLVPCRPLLAAPAVQCVAAASTH